MGDLRVFAGEPQPQGLIRVARPEILWRIWPGIKAAFLTLDGKPIATRYDSGRRAVVARPAIAISPGIHRVRCQVTFESGAQTSREWRFTVASQRIEISATSSEVQREAAAFVNRFRTTLGLASLKTDPSLQAAAEAHVRYLSRNHAGGHREAPGKPGFTGSNPSERARGFGFTEDSLVEDVATLMGARELTVLGRAVTGLYDAPYHRLPFMNPTLARLGTAFEVQGESSHTVLLFGGTDDPSRSPQTVVSPANGQSDIPTLWMDHETPDPLRLHEPTTLPVGYPILFAYFAARIAESAPSVLRINGASLFGPDGKRLELLVSDPRSDPELNGEAALFVPRLPLLLGKTYRVEVNARDGQGRDISRTWRFATRR